MGNDGSGKRSLTLQSASLSMANRCGSSLFETACPAEFA